MDDPFRHHPALRGRITDPLASSFRAFRPADFDARMAAMGRPDWRYSDAEIAADEAAFLRGHGPRDLWVFAYGSLMWDPAVWFAEVRMGRIEGYARRFCLNDPGARGTANAPGLMAALDEGAGCTGLVFRIEAALLAEELGYLWRRERLAPGYRALMVPVETGQGTMEALAFVIDHTAPNYVPALSFDEQVRRIATAKGELGTNRAYLEGVAAQFAALDIEDADVAALMAGLAAFDRARAAALHG